MLSNPDAAAASTSKKPDLSLGKKSQEGSKRKNDNSQGDGGKKIKGDTQYVPLYQVHTELNQSQEQIFLADEKIAPFRRADTMRGQNTKRDPDKYCRYHRDRGHTTDECKQLKDEIEGLISIGYMRQYVGNQADHPRNNNNGRKAQHPQALPWNQAPTDKGMPTPIERVDIVTIAGGPHPPRTSRNSQKWYVNELKTSDGTPHVPKPRAPKHERVESLHITFTEEDASLVQFFHHDPLVITVHVANRRIH